MTDFEKIYDFENLYKAHGKVVRRGRQQTKYEYKRKLHKMQELYARNEMSLAEIRQVLTSYHSHLSHGNTHSLEKRALAGFCLCKSAMKQ